MEKGKKGEDREKEGGRKSKEVREYVGVKERGLVRKMEWKDKEDRRKNFIIEFYRRLEMKKEKRKEAVEEVLKIMGVTIDVKEIRRLGGKRQTGKEWC